MAYRGVYPTGEKFRALIGNKGERESLGTFDTEIEAATVYDKKAHELFGDKARLNFPRKDCQIMLVDLANLRLDGGTQSRDSIDEATVAEYAEYAEDLPAGDAFFDGSHYWLASGFHRYFGRKRAGKSDMAVTVHKGTCRDAILFSAGSNATHGLKRSNADKVKALKMLMGDKEWAGRSRKWIADTIHVSPGFVAEHWDSSLLNNNVADKTSEAEPEVKEPEAVAANSQKAAPAPTQAKVTRKDKKGRNQPAVKPRAAKPSDNGKPTFDDKLVERLIGELGRAFSDRAKAIGKGPLHTACHDAMDAVASAWKAWKKG